MRIKLRPVSTMGPAAHRLLMLHAAVGLLGCGGPSPEVSPVATTESPIAYGNADTTHTAVVAVLSPANVQSFQECSGSIVQVQGEIATVLTAAHCCNTYVPTVVVAFGDYSIGEDAVLGGSFSPPVYSVVAGSVYYDPLYSASNGQDHDFCLLQFSGAHSSTATLALPPATGDGLTFASTSPPASSIEHIGFGQTDTSTGNTQRRTGIDSVNLQLSSLIIEFSQGGTRHIPGTCDGDSGGPALLPAGSAQASQVVVGVQSYGDAFSCATATFGVASRVTSEIGPGRFITSYLTGTPTGVRAGVVAPAPASSHWALFATALALLSAGLAQTRAPARTTQGQRLIAEGNRSYP